MTVPAIVYRQRNWLLRSFARIGVAGSIASAPATSAVTIAGAALLVAVLAATQGWLDRHFLPSFFLPRLWYVRLETTVRLILGGAAVALIVARRRVTRGLARAPIRVVSMVAAAALALGASEMVLRSVRPRPTEWLISDEEPRRRVDPRLGWVIDPGRSGHVVVGGRSIEYAIDANGYRVRRGDAPVDLAAPTMLFTGESVMFGEGLAWDETIPAQVESALGVQTANLAVHGYSIDQAYLRLETELPRFRRPVAVVTVFMSALFGRNLDDDRPHLGPGLTWMPAQPSPRLLSLAALLVPYRTDATVERGIGMTTSALQATVDLARRAGARPLILVPQIGPESPPESALRRRILDAAALPYVFVEIDPSWHVPWDRHPDARADRRIGRAVAERLREP